MNTEILDAILAFAVIACAVLACAVIAGAVLASPRVYRWARCRPKPPVRTHRINNDRTVAVATDRYWLPITDQTPRGVKLNLLTAHGVGVTGILTADNTKHFRGWEPLARVPRGMLS